jgi:ferritin
MHDGMRHNQQRVPGPEVVMKQAVQDAVNEQIKHELSSAYVYLSMSAHFDAENLPGFAKWMRMQSQEEMNHALRLFDYVNHRGGRVVLQAIEQPPHQFSTPLGIFEHALEHETKVTQLIERLYETAIEHKDYATQVEIQWFITEQVEEEDTATLIVEQLRMAGDNRAALLMMDRQLGARSTAG